MTQEEKDELINLREFKKLHEIKPLEIAFDRLAGLIAIPYSRGFDGVMSVAAFRVIAECLIELKKEICK